MPSKDVLFIQQQQQEEQNRINNNNNDINDFVMMKTAAAATTTTTTTTSTTQDFIARDVDLLVAEIKENLRLRAPRSCRASACRQRPSPYKVPSSSSAPSAPGSGCCPLRTPFLKKPHSDSSDPYELLQELLKEGSLIKEAVKRLQTTEEGGDHPLDEDEDGNGKRNPTKSFYDDLESHSPRPDILV